MRTAFAIVVLWTASFGALTAAELTPLEQAGKRLFFDDQLSSPVGQSCASCHGPEAGFSGPHSEINRQTGIYPGALKGRFGNRKPPSAAYASYSPARTYDDKDETYVGGQFWDGRGADLVEQAKGPFLNPLEMNNASAWVVVQKVQKAAYRPLLEQLFGKEVLNVDERGADKAFHKIAQAIAAYESSREVNAFSSKYDAYLANRAALTPAETRGLALFAGKANCTACHPHQKGDDGSPPLFTDFTYDNVGTPRNTVNPFFQQAAEFNPDGAKFRDLGIGAIVKQPEHHGKVKVPTLRNVAKKPDPQFVKAFLHNGVFKDLKEVVHFYNVRDVTPDAFGPPDVQENVNKDELGRLGLTDAEENDIVAFLETLSDGFSTPTAPPKPLPPQVSGGTFPAARDVLRVDRLIRHRTATLQRDDTIRR